ncbi:hypothetical protein ABPG72_017638 [Tetrahymena utriculariae]
MLYSNDKSIKGEEKLVGLILGYQRNQIDFISIKAILDSRVQSQDDWSSLNKYDSDLSNSLGRDGQLKFQQKQVTNKSKKILEVVEEKRKGKSSNNICAKGASALGSALANFANLTHLILGLGYNQIGAQGASALSSGLANCSNLTNLTLYLSIIACEHEEKIYQSTLTNQVISEIKIIVEKEPLKSDYYLYKTFITSTKILDVTYNQFKAVSKQDKSEILPEINPFQFDKIISYFKGFVAEAFIISLPDNLDIICIILMSQMRANQLSRAEQCNIDFKFNYSLRGFYQMGAVSMQDEILGENRIGAYFLVNPKAQIVYERMLQSFIDCLKNKFSVSLKIKIAIMDMEISLQNAWKNKIGSQIRSCFFHVVKNIWEHASDYGLKKKNLLFYTSLIINNLKVALHIQEYEEKIKFITNMQQVLLEQNIYDKPKDKLDTYYKFLSKITSIYIDKNSTFSKNLTYQQYLLNPQDPLNK